MDRFCSGLFRGAVVLSRWFVVVKGRSVAGTGAVVAAVGDGLVVSVEDGVVAAVDNGGVVVV
ncbi:hypothetical protein BLL38_14805 [Pseudomonas gessardii]|nr:hypothetical protein BLL38_14805 [Pseudomonas gessardii]